MPSILNSTYKSFTTAGYIFYTNSTVYTLFSKPAFVAAVPDLIGEWNYEYLEWKSYLILLNLYRNEGRHFAQYVDHVCHHHLVISVKTCVIKNRQYSLLVN